MKTPTLNRDRLTPAQQRARIRLAAAAAALELQRFHDPLPGHVADAEDYHHRLSGKD